MDAKLLEYRNGYRDAVDFADIFAVQINFALDGRLGCKGHIVVREPFGFGNVLKNRTDGCFLRAGANHIAVSTLAKNGRNRIDYDGFTGTGLAGHNIEAALKQDVCPLDDGNILDVQQTEHGAFPLLLKHFADFVTETLCRRGIPHNHECCIVT